MHKYEDRYKGDDEIMTAADMDYIGECFGLRVVARGEKDNHKTIELFIEDDEYYHFQFKVSGYWVKDLINVLRKADSVEKFTI